MSLSDWVRFFIEYIVPDDLNEETTRSFLLHLADLDLLIPTDEDIWSWNGEDSKTASDSLIAIVQKDLLAVCDTEPGFALPYFIGYQQLEIKPIAFNAKVDTQNAVKNKPASDLSNLQIVKKVGKQLQPFLQMEQNFVSRLTGKHAGKQDAQKLFHYIFGKIGTKAEPRAWEQLSRKRHR